MKKTLLSLTLALIGWGTFAQENATLIVPPNAPYQKEFGQSVSMVPHSNKIAIGTEFGDFFGSVFLYDGTTFIKKIKGSDVDPQTSRFGYSVAIDQSYLVVGAYSATVGSSGFAHGKVYVFHDPSGNANFGDTPLQELSVGVDRAEFGYHVEVSGNWLAVSARGQNRVYLYKKDGPASAPWVQYQVIQGTDNISGAVALNGNLLVIGENTSFGSSTKGNVSIYQEQWNGFQKIYDRKAAGLPSWATSKYGSGVGVYGNRVIIGDESAAKAEVISGWGSSWSQMSVLTAPGVNPYTGFGNSVAVKDNYAVVVDQFGAAAYAFVESGQQFSYKGEITPEHELVSVSKVSDVAINNQGKVVITAPHTDLPETPGVFDRGVAYFGDLFDLTKDCSSAYEYNDNRWNAKDIQLYTPVYACIGYNNDVDYYKIHVEGEESISFSLSELSANFDMQIYDGNHNLLHTCNLTGTHNEYYAAYLTPGDYLIKVYAANGATTSTSPYKLITRGSSCFEFNDNDYGSALKAVDLSQTSAQFLQGALKESYEEDWYAFHVGSTQNILITLKNLYADFDIHLYDENLTRIAYSWRASVNDEEIFLEDIPAGDYYLRVDGWSSAKSNECYHLSIKTGPFLTPEKRGVAAEVEKNTKTEGNLNLYPNVLTQGGSHTVALDFGNPIETTMMIQIIQVSTGQTVFKEEVTVKGEQTYLSLPSLSSGLYLVNAGQGGTSKLLVK